ncbi:MAG: GNAT family N-acetyltransferase [Granulosicoccus sp.]
MQINFASFRQLDVDTLYALIKMRVDVFVVEQACAYPELDGLDLGPGTWHVLGYDNDKLIAYARILNLHQDGYLPHANITEPIRIGRVLVEKRFRSRGYATSLLQSAIDYIRSKQPERSIELAAQVEVCKLYEALGFHSISDHYLEDGILHVDMRLR